MTVASVTITARGRQAAAVLPWPSLPGPLATTVPAEWGRVDGLVLFCALGAAVRLIAPLLRDKHTDPAVVVVDDSHRWVIPVTGGHAGGANDLARHVAALLGAEAVITTASDGVGLPPLDAMPGFRAAGDVAGVTRALLDGDPVAYEPLPGWPLPAALRDRLGPSGAARVVVTDAVSHAGPGVVALTPPTLVVGVGSSSGAPADELADLADETLAAAGFSTAAVGCVATLDRKRDEPAIVALAARWGVELRWFDPATLGATPVPNPSQVVAAAVGTPSVAEAAALCGAGAGAELVSGKRSSATATVAVARRRGPAGHLSVVGLGPGGAQHRTPAATAAIRSAGCVVGYGPYVDLVADAVGPAATVEPSPIGAEVQRAERALERAATGERVALVCSGDAGVYALAGLVFELAGRYPGLDPRTDITVVPGVTAALTAAGALGAPLGHDHAAISLSDLLTDWAAIERRLVAAAEADLVVSIYNPRSAGRTWQLPRAVEILAAHRPAETPVGVVTDGGRPGEHVTLTTLAGLDAAIVGMTTLVIIGSSTTRVVGGRMVTPRGYGP